MATKYVVSESVCAGHPDKLSDRISDAILDAALAQDPQARVAAETLLAHNQIVLAGEVTTSADIDFENIARRVISEQGFTHPEWGFSDQSPILNAIHKQSPEISVGVDNDGAGDQGLMYGYACNETSQYLPLSVVLAHGLTKQIDKVRRESIIAYLRPDGKSQVVLAYEGHEVRVQHITIAVPHNEDIGLATVTKDIIKHVIRPVLEGHNLDLPKEIIINGTGVWHLPGPSSDVGLTGRKIVVDTYGGVARVGGGAFSGKDPSKVDRSGAYAARYIAKNIVAKDLADKAEVCLAYYIGAKKPIVMQINTFGTAAVSDKVINNFANNLLDCSVVGIISTLKLKQPIYEQTSAYGHFGNDIFPWEQIK